jgi:hypothetical protein
MEKIMKKPWLATLSLTLALAAMGRPVALADDGNQSHAAASVRSGDGSAPSTSGRASHQARSDSYAEREQASRDLEPFTGGRQVIIATEYDVHILVSVVLVTAIVLLVILL